MDDLFDSLPRRTEPRATASTKRAAKGQVVSPARSPRAAAAAAHAEQPQRSFGYSAEDIEVLEGLEPVRRRPAMYIGGSDERAMHHLVAELLDNAMDEAVAGHATRIELDLAADGTVTVRDNGRGIPVEAHPKFPGKSALEVILTTLHSGGKFSGKVYHTAGGLHGVGLSVVNALSERLTVEVVRDRILWTQRYRRGAPCGPLENRGAVSNRRGTTVSFHPDDHIFGDQARFRPGDLHRMVRSKAYLYGGVEIRWTCHPSLIGDGDATPATATLRFPGGLRDYLTSTLGESTTITPELFAGKVDFDGDAGKVEWAVAWPEDEAGFSRSYCNTVPTPLGGTHEAGLRTALLKGLRNHADLIGNKSAARVTAEDVAGGACAMLSVFIREPQFQGQTKEKLTSAEAGRLVEQVVRDHFDHWLSAVPETARTLLDRVVERAETRLRRAQDKKTRRQSATRKLRLPGKLADCSRTTAAGTEVFLVEGDSAGGSAKSARDRETQAVLPLRGKILNVASASGEKLRANQELSNLIEALGCGFGAGFDVSALRYEKVIIMTDADVDGAHIAALLMTFFFKEMPKLIEHGHLYLAVPPLYRLTQGAKSVYARDDAHKEALIGSAFAGRGKVEISRFKGLGEMPPAQLKSTTMDPKTRTLLRVTIAGDHDRPAADAGEELSHARVTADLIETLMGRKPELRFAYIQDHARFVEEVDV